MNITIVTVGKIKDKYLKMGLAEFEKRLKPYAKMNVVEVADEKAPESLSQADMEIVKEKEAQRILAKIGADAHVIALAIEGKMKTSEQLAADIESLMTYGKSKICFVIGGSLGLHESVYKRANELLSFSKMTFPHQLMKLILMEQVYRAFKIMKNEPYHK
ncbi:MULTISPECIES: 23S rRNA (pseudouridine(1915)-N(3))-methyltransferase RlmH [Sporosarcina]|uniref:Ribosomal RNA large subunit methyltransferase H n=2 Tax=Sporosarcina TaxID=1569 RepID=A0A380CLL6_SPOPA|nr:MULTISPECIES: 23S rRNA (pseudouridine(1915)-N(3))-methyltransferase RlmH [Sporosarcina]MDS9471861.1 23S rRNA (pseudouridine(1915)-N(3))-methyltransferase RlmH [Sporosarcina pasteurii]QBQ06600.1 23S rRNA (pseudouridine(1915)-N(3))-methyltransferase RlmH [Sporosarcina pasteurii]SUJ22003.1 Ribosomal RNA large subunit methyltransferase H [Sporosarcina pasteurii]